MQAWKGMLDADGFLKLVGFMTCDYISSVILVHHFIDQALSKDAGYATATLDHSESGGYCSSRLLYLHGRLMILYGVCYILVCGYHMQCFLVNNIDLERHALT